MFGLVGPGNEQVTGVVNVIDGELKNEIVAAMTKESSASKGEELLGQLWSTDTLKKMDCKSLVTIYKRLILGYHPLQSDGDAKTKVESIRQVLDQRLRAIMLKYKTVNSMYLVQARSKDDMENTYDKIWADLKKKIDYAKVEKFGSKEMEKKFWEKHGAEANGIFYVGSKAFDYGKTTGKNAPLTLLTRAWLYGIANACLTDIAALRYGKCETDNKKIFDSKTGRIEHANTHLFGVRAWKHWATFLYKNIDLIFPTVGELRSRSNTFSMDFPTLKDTANDKKRVLLGQTGMLTPYDSLEAVSESDGTTVIRPIFEFMLKVASQIKLPVKPEKLVRARVSDWVKDLKLARKEAVERGIGVSDIKKAVDAIDILLSVLANKSGTEWGAVNTEGKLDPQTKSYDDIATSVDALRQIDHFFVAVIKLSDYPPDGYIKLLFLRQKFVNVIEKLININSPRAYIRELLIDYMQTTGVLSYIYAPTENEKASINAGYLRGVWKAFLRLLKKESSILPMNPSDSPKNGGAKWDDEIKRMNSVINDATRYIDELGNPEALSIKMITMRGPRTKIGDYADEYGNVTENEKPFMDTSNE